MHILPRGDGRRQPELGNVCPRGCGEDQQQAHQDNQVREGVDGRSHPRRDCGPTGKDRDRIRRLCMARGLKEVLQQLQFRRGRDPVLLPFLWQLEQDGNRYRGPVQQQPIRQRDGSRLPRPEQVHRQLGVPVDDGRRERDCHGSRERAILLSFRGSSLFHPLRPRHHYPTVPSGRKDHRPQRSQFRHSGKRLPSDVLFADSDEPQQSSRPPRRNGQRVLPPDLRPMVGLQQPVHERL